ncbi:hypothetical protein EAX62_11040 [Tessaracoccus antarcticus]|uniref:Uncharacterized protein n=2 Tax=Tessaracoccus antarcticus TaxID=2479848 RepID=A0A3M0G6S1_9ACTN|nr:hypothetical protein EAX62_11040 [Tessaracoccus antarcticus]
MVLTVATFALAGVLGSLMIPSAAASGEPVCDSAASVEWQWICSQLGTGTPVSTTSTIAPDSDYPPEWTGPVSGTFTLRDVAAPATIAGSPVVIDTPVSLADAYRGLVAGHVELPQEPGRWIINVLRTTDAGTAQAQLQTMVNADGTFTLDLGTARAQEPGSWGFQVLDSLHGYVQEGATWPQPAVLDGLEVRAIVVTDTAYVIDTVEVHADNTFAFPSSRPGTKVFQLIDTTSGSVLAEHAPTTGLVRSYDAAVGTPAHGRTFTYDQALSVITAESVGDDALAQQLARGLMRLQSVGGRNDGAFVTSAAALNPEAAQREYRTGNHSIATYALLRRLGDLSPSDPDRPALVSSTTRGVEWLLAQQQSGGIMDGLVTGGSGSLRPDGSFDPSTSIPWASTEHNLDAWHTLRLAAEVLDDHAADRGAARLETAILTRLWNPVTGRFHQGWQPEGADPTPMLDLNSWGAIFLQKVGRADLAAGSLSHAQDFFVTDSAVSGYAPRLPTVSTAGVWFEGSAGVALAQGRLGQGSAAAVTMGRLEAGRLASGAWPEATRVDASMDMTNDPAIAATAWVLLARASLSGHPTIWDD